MNSDQPTLYLTVGLPYSGKSSWSRKHGAPIVSPDEIRRHVHGGKFVPEAEGLIWYITRIMVRSLFTCGHTEVILDACSVSDKRRSYWRTSDWNCKYVIFPVEKQICIERAKMARDDAILSVIERMAGEWEILSREEAFDAIEPEDQFNDPEIAEALPIG